MTLANTHSVKTHLLLVLKADLTHGHAAVLLQVRPWCVDDRNVVLFVTWGALAEQTAHEGNFHKVFKTK